MHQSFQKIAALKIYARTCQYLLLQKGTPLQKICPEFSKILKTDKAEDPSLETFNLLKRNPILEILLEIFQSFPNTFEKF